MKTSFLATASVLLVTFVILVGATPEWDDLKVTWGVNIFSKFKSQPRTMADAVNNGFKHVGPKICDGSNRYNGLAYVKDNDYALTLLYDINGFIAGIQIGITEDQAEQTKYPSPKLRPPFVNDGYTMDRWVLTAYFTDPSKICTEGRTKEQFDEEGTGENLWIQTNANPMKLMKIAKKEENIEAPWVKGKCFYTMGNHYWYNITDNMDCNAFFPVFLLYNEEKLNGFGWALVADLPSSHYEHPGKETFGLFMESVPKCLTNRGPISTMHIYMTSFPWLNAC
ncbi:hypothetical protein PoB_002925400 [Plakobranchus ocellatus]|uniref:Uncharacterized protein n=1 Tax=Plakobranchus ocellatus TaxID=259542 RepID=A0AAV4A4Z7_9GAST|nr:hypothetical protein PoB_002925400 [Plakobranchus ocellatus]